MKTIGTTLLVLFLALPAAAQIPVADVHVVNSPNVLAWPVTTQITRLDLRATGVHLEFDKQGYWPDVTPPGWDGPIQYTLWLFLDIGGEWYASGIIQFWRGESEGGGPVTVDRQIAREWLYDTRWSAMINHQPAPGEHVGFMVSAGNARGQDDHAVQERSNIVEIAFPASPGTFPPYLWAEGSAPPVVVLPPPPAPVVVIPQPVPPVYVPPAPLPSVDLSGLYSQLAVLNLKVDAIAASVAASRAENTTFYEAVKTQWKAIVGKAAIYAGPIIAAIFAGRATKP